MHRRTRRASGLHNMHSKFVRISSIGSKVMCEHWMKRPMTRRQAELYLDRMHDRASHAKLQKIETSYTMPHNIMTSRETWIVSIYGPSNRFNFKMTTISCCCITTKSVKSRKADGILIPCTVDPVVPASNPSFSSQEVSIGCMTHDENKNSSTASSRQRASLIKSNSQAVQ